MKGIFQIKPPCENFSLLGMFIQTLAATHVIIHSLPNVRGTGNLKQSKNIEPFNVLEAIRKVLV